MLVESMVCICLVSLRNMVYPPKSRKVLPAPRKEYPLIVLRGLSGCPSTTPTGDPGNYTYRIMLLQPPFLIIRPSMARLVGGLRPQNHSHGFGPRFLG